MATYDEVSTSGMVADPVATMIRNRFGVNTEAMSFTDVTSQDYDPRAEAVSEMLACVLLSIEGRYDHLALSDVDFQDALHLTWEIVFTELFAVDDISVYDPGYYQRIVERLNVSSSVIPNTSTTQVLVDAINIIDSLLSSWGITIVESMNISDALVDNIKFVKALVETITLADTAQGNNSIYVVTEDTMDITSILSVLQSLHVGITDTAIIGGGIEFNDESYTFVLNTTTQAISTYDNFNFNSIDGNMACTSTGIYQLTGDTDNGTNINAYFRTALSDFSSDKISGLNLKQIREAYIGFTSDGSIIFKTITDNNGEKKERWYKNIQTRAAVDTARVKMGRGVRARYWQFEIANFEGSDFDVESIDLLPIELKRRVN